MDVQSNVYDYKIYHQEFMRNHNGTTAFEVLLVILPAPFGIFLSTYLCAVLTYLVNQKMLIRLKLVNWLLFLVDFVMIVVPLVLNVTIFSDIHVVSSQMFLLGLCICVAYCCTLCRQIFSRDYVSTLLASLVVTSRRPFVTNFRATVNLITAICILAVDFKVFPRRFAKTETFGYSLMDTGVGLFVVSHAVVAPEAVGNKAKSQTFTSTMWIAVKSSIPLLLLGSARFFITQQIDYQMHVSEYGVHWNFYLTLAGTKILSTLILQFVGSNYSLIISVVVIGIHELILCSGIQEWVLSNVERRDFLTANREGITSLLGYVSLYFAGVCLGQGLRDCKSSFLGNLYLMGKITLISVFLWFIMLLCGNWFGVSRRLANIGYVTWMLTLSIMLLMMVMAIELLTCTLNKVVKTSMQSEADRYSSFTISYVPVTLEAINYNGLLFFLLSNLLTGFINIYVQTLTVGVLQSLLIIFGYTFVLCTIITLLYSKNLKVKMW